MHIDTYSKSPTGDQLAQLTGIFVREAASCSRGGLQDALEGRFVDERIRRLLDELSAYSCDFRQSNADYPIGYPGLRNVYEQLEMVSDAFKIPSGPAKNVIRAGLPKYPDFMEGWAAIPIEFLLPKKPSDRLEKALLWMNEVMEHPGYIPSGWGVEGFYPYDHACREYDAPGNFDGNLGMRKHEEFLRDFHRKHGGKIAIVPVQMGYLRRGQSDRMARAQCWRSKSEIPATSFEVACLLAMHPKRVGGEGILSANCPGDMFTEAAHKKIGFGDGALQNMSFDGGFLSGKPLIYSHFASRTLRDPLHGPITFAKWDI